MWAFHSRCAAKLRSDFVLILCNYSGLQLLLRLQNCGYSGFKYKNQRRQQSSPLNLRIEAPMQNILERDATAKLFVKKDNRYKPTRLGRAINMDINKPQ
jgi:hypothetical protein